MADVETKVQGSLTREKAVFPNPVVARYETDLIILGREARKRWQTEKARTVAELDFFPLENRIPQVIFPKEDIQGIKASMLEVLAKGARVGLRECLLEPNLGKGKWLMNLQSPEEVEMFFGLREIKKPLWLTAKENPLINYQQIRKNPESVELIVHANPAGLGLKDLDKQHFAMGIFFLRNELVVELIPHTSQLRDFDKKTPLQLRMNLGESVHSFSQETLIVTSPEKSYYLTNGETLVPELGQLTEEIKELVFNQWWLPPFHLPYRLKALENITDNRVLEFQGRQKEGHLEYLLIYGLKGIRG
jgi:hypothetical protein